jgi:4-amino-4-deoxy-L-arabinose transferase-like glycosyltransferase
MRKFTKLFIGVLFLVALYLRFYQLSSWFFFNVDEEWFLYIVRKLVQFKQPLLVGWEMPGGLLTTPVMYYVGGFLMWIGGNNPLALAVHAALVSTITVVLVFLVGRELFGRRIAVIASIIFCASYIVNIYSRLTLSVYLGPLLSLLTYISLAKIKDKNSSIWLLPLAVVCIFSTQEGSLISLIILVFIFIVYYFRQLNKKLLILSFSLFCISFIPLFIFDLRHEFLATKRIVRFFAFKNEHNRNKKFVLNATLNNFNNFGSSLVRVFLPTGDADMNKQILPCSQYMLDKQRKTPYFYGIAGIVIAGLFILISLGNPKASIGQKIISLHLLIISGGLLIFSLFMPGHQYEWFFVLLFPAYVYIVACFCEKVWQIRGKLFRVGLIVLISLSLFINLEKTSLGTTTVGYEDKLRAMQFIKAHVANKTFELTYLGNGCNAYGYRYLLTYIGAEPNITYTDNNYAGWLYPTPKTVIPIYKVILVPVPDLKPEEQAEYTQLKSRSLNTFKEKNLEVFIVQNI